MSDPEWDALDFAKRFRNGEFDGRLRETLASLSPQQIEELHRVLLTQGETRDAIVPDDLKRNE